MEGGIHFSLRFANDNENLPKLNVNINYTANKAAKSNTNSNTNLESSCGKYYALSKESQTAEHAKHEIFINKKPVQVCTGHGHPSWPYHCRGTLHIEDHFVVLTRQCNLLLRQTIILLKICFFTEHVFITI